MPEPTIPQVRDSSIEEALRADWKAIGGDLGWAIQVVTQSESERLGEAAKAQAG